MGKIVVVQEFPGSWECSGHEEVYCFAYTSPEAWLIDFETKLKEVVERKMKNWENISQEFEFCGQIFECGDLCNMSEKNIEYRLPKVFSLNEWFNSRVFESDKKESFDTKK